MWKARKKEEVRGGGEGGGGGESKKKKRKNIYCFLRSKHSSKCCTCINSFNSHNIPVTSPAHISIF